MELKVQSPHPAPSAGSGAGAAPGGPGALPAGIAVRLRDVWEGGNDLFSLLSGEEQCSAHLPLDVTVGAGLGLLALLEQKRPGRKNPTLLSSSVTVRNQHLIKTSHKIIYIP